MIPKVIHYCWFGGKEKPDLVKRCLASWKKFCPDYQIIEWNETNTDIQMNAYVQRSFQEKKWAYLTDYIRLYIIFNYGGIYLDTDVEIIRNIDELTKLDYFLACETNEIINTGLGFGAQKGNKIIGAMLNEYEQRFNFSGGNNIEYISCPELNTIAVNKYYQPFNLEGKKWIELEGGKIFAPEFFCPKSFSTMKIEITENTYSIHHFDGSWLSPYVKFKVSIRAFFRRTFG